MKTFVSEGKTIEVPNIEVVSAEKRVLQITEGEHAGICFTLDNMRMDDTDESLMWYDLDITDPTGNPQPMAVDKIKETVDNFIMLLLHESIERAENESSDS